jgi:hypothetical protein
MQNIQIKLVTKGGGCKCGRAVNPLPVEGMIVWPLLPK